MFLLKFLKKNRGGGSKGDFYGQELITGTDTVGAKELITLQTGDIKIHWNV